ncbi:cyanophycinase [candidate division KSB1 bacterium]|nr:cyanophycinase [candidate division KSB1 bacterium]
MKRHTYLLCIVVAVLAILSIRCSEDDEQGYLFIIGGGKRPADALQKFVRLCKGGPVLMITSASSVPHESGLAGVEQFIKQGAEDVSYIHIDGVETANADTTVNRIRRCRGIYFTGGVQQRLMKRIGGTRAESAIRQVYAAGGIIGGTSAGAAVMSRVMITGNELVQKDSTNAFSTIQAGNIETENGFGFIDEAIIDQHFVKRKRNNRLISCVLEHPNLLGIGIDESTAILVYPDDHFEVFGTGTVLIYDARDARNISVDGNGRLRARDMDLHVLTAGDSFQLD